MNTAGIGPDLSVQAQNAHVHPRWRVGNTQGVGGEAIGAVGRLGLGFQLRAVGPELVNTAHQVHGDALGHVGPGRYQVRDGIAEGIDGSPIFGGRVQFGVFQGNGRQIYVGNAYRFRGGICRSFRWVRLQQ